ncbi:MAG: metallophosphoesterase [Burkholderiales bacterium]|nr:metallophosphoesterase [Burkholderiales bacterium]
MNDPIKTKRPILIDPRRGDVEDDASSPEKRSMVAIAGSLLAEISLPKLAVAWILMIGVPGLMLGLAPLVGSAWTHALSARLGTLAGLGPVLVLAGLFAVAWFGGRAAFRIVEKSFWSLNSLAVQPGYAVFREGLRHMAEALLLRGADADRRATVNATIAGAAGLLSCLVALGVCALAWPHTQWRGDLGALATPLALVVPALANAVVVVGAMMAGASLVWGLADATMDQPRTIERLEEDQPGDAPWRVAHLSDIHIVGERYGMRIESGRAGPSGNHRLEKALDRLAAIHARDPLDVVLVTGDMTDAGRSAEWVEFARIIAHHPELAARTLVLPGNHDLNIVDRANPARMDLPISPFKRLRQLRTLSAMAAVQGDRVRVLDADRNAPGPTLDEAIAPHAAAIAAFADTGPFRLQVELTKLWADVFPMVLPPARPDGLGVILLNSNAETHFSFTNALGLVSAEQMAGILTLARHYPQARWVVALHHHLVEYPKPAKAFSERIGTALINGSWAVRQFKRIGPRMVAMHGHRHIDWIGACGTVRIISAPSPVMGGTDDMPTRFHIHRLAARPGGGLALLAPETVDIEGDPPA